MSREPHSKNATKKLKPSTTTTTSSDDDANSSGSGAPVTTSTVAPIIRVQTEEIMSLRQRLDAQLASLLPPTAAKAATTTTTTTTSNNNTQPTTSQQQKRNLDPDQHWVVRFFKRNGVG